MPRAKIALSPAERAAENRGLLADALAHLDALSDATLDEYRRLGEALGTRIVLGNSGVSGDDLAQACDAEIAARFIAVRA